MDKAAATLKNNPEVFKELQTVAASTGQDLRTLGEMATGPAVCGCRPPASGESAHLCHTRVLRPGTQVGQKTNPTPPHPKDGGATRREGSGFLSHFKRQKPLFLAGPHTSGRLPYFSDRVP
ncbi:hypothetical protein HJG60_008330 [Phyllostomus discolor]|uniref:Uncharacterized protein n=1 Tax=Phyllostomus discolor TaxID=89673 RepID=A0A834DSN0_9CHIR|nr:hypothetical protein HJG60_008330 [Phyllostomus discolor]